MAHGLEETDTMFYAAENGPPWHISETKDRSFGVDEAPTSAEALAVAKLDWEVELKPAYFRQGNTVKKVPRHFVVVRSDIGEGIGTVQGGYRPIQNRDMFGFLDSLVATGDLRYETAGSLWGGRHVWMLARVPTEINLGGDRQFPYLLARSAHDGTGACKVLPTLVRVVCNNTLSMALFSRDADVRRMTVSVRHVGEVMDKLAKAREILDLGLLSFERFQQVGEILLDTDGLPLVGPLLEKLFPPRKGQDELTKGVEAEREKFGEILAAEVNRHEGGTSAYDLLNAVTGYADHVRAVTKTRGGELQGKQAARMNSVFFGGAADLKEKGLDWILEIGDLYQRLEEAKVPVRIRRKQTETAA